MLVTRRWGAGKSSLIELIKKESDNSVVEKNSKLLQSFEKDQQSDYAAVFNKLVYIVCTLPIISVIVQGFQQCDSKLLMKIYPVVWKPVPMIIISILVALIAFFVVSIPDFFSFFKSTLMGLLQKLSTISLNGIYTACTRNNKMITTVLIVIVFLSGFFIFRPTTALVILKITDEIVESIAGILFSTKSIENSKAETSNKAEKEYIFVDFNAWEFSASEELWTGLIRNLYEKVELRMSKTSIDLKKEGKAANGAGFNWKDKWRVKKAIECLEETYGGKALLHIRCLILFFSVIFIGVVTIWYSIPEVFDMTSDYEDVLAALVTVLPGVAWLKVFVDILTVMNTVSDTSMGEKIFEESKTIRDRTGFMSEVRRELSELFNFINEDFRQDTGIQLVLVLFIDDLDRVLEGRNVKMLEAVHLLLNVPGAPVFVFLAIDSRIVVASIEQQLSKHSNLNGVRITGWDYLEKLVQIPFCLPEVAPERMQHYFEMSLRIDITEEQLKESLVDFKNEICPVINNIANLQCRFPSTSASTGGSFVVSAKSLIADIESGSSIKAVADRLGVKYPVDTTDKEEMEAFYSDLHSMLPKAKFFDGPVVPLAPQPDVEPNDKPSADPLPKISTLSNLPSQPVTDVTTTEKEVIIPFKTKTTSQRLPDTMVDVLKLISSKVDCNPRGVKRLINLLQIIAEIGSIKPLTGQSPPVSLKAWKSGEVWTQFSKKAVIWIFMAQGFSFRLSALVQILLDFDQKRDFNAKDCKYKYKPCHRSHESSGDSKITIRNDIEVKPDHNEESTNGTSSKDKVEEKGMVIDFDDMPIFEFYMSFVEKYIYALPCSERLLRVDKDPEDFAYLLQLSLEYELKCEDILGPKINLGTDKEDKSSERMRDFSLLAYSFNLDPAMRLEVCTGSRMFYFLLLMIINIFIQIGEDIAGLVSEHELFKGDGDVVALRSRSIIRKKDLLNFKHNN